MSEKLYKYLPPERTGFYKNIDDTIMPGFFPNLTLIASKLSDLNDPFEGILAFSNIYPKEHINELRDGFYKIVNSRLGVISLSRKSDSIPMWAYYAKGHTGFVVEIDRCRNENIFLKPSKRNADFKDINYVDDLIKSPKKLSDFPVEIFHTKSKEWSHENEVRIMLPRDPNSNTDKPNLWEFNPQVISGIIFGMKMEKCYKTEIIKYCSVNSNLSHIKLYQAKLSTTEYKIQIEQLSI